MPIRRHFTIFRTQRGMSSSTTSVPIMTCYNLTGCRTRAKNSIIARRYKKQEAQQNKVLSARLNASKIMWQSPHMGRGNIDTEIQNPLLSFLYGCPENATNFRNLHTTLNMPFTDQSFFSAHISTSPYSKGQGQYLEVSGVPVRTPKMNITCALQE